MAHVSRRRPLRRAWVFGCLLVTVAAGAATGSVDEVRAAGGGGAAVAGGVTSGIEVSGLSGAEISGVATSGRAPLDRVMARVETTEPFASVAGPAVVEYYVDERRGYVAVGVREVTPRVRRAARRTFGDAVRLHEAERYYRVSRRDDPVPHTAGTSIRTPLGVCTSGFGVVRGGMTHFLAPGHCFRGPGDRVSNAGRPYGRVVERRFVANGPDAALVASAFGPRMYVGGPNSDTSVAVTGRARPPHGARLCTSGSYTGENCAAQRREANLCVRFGDGMTTCNLTRAVSTDGSALVGPGDSGGPLYVGGARAVGITVGGSRDGTQLLYHPVGFLLDLWDARLLTTSAPVGGVLPRR